MLQIEFQRKMFVRLFLFLLFEASCASALAQTAQRLRWAELPPIPGSQGVAGPLVGTHNGALLVAGGANFPEKKPWEGGTKVWYDSVHVLEKPDGQWRLAGELSRPLGYSVSLSTKQGVACLGGSDAQRHYADCFLLQWGNNALRTTPLPALPKPCANFSGALLGDTIFVAGGLENPAATSTLKTFWSLDLSASSPTWKVLDPWPGPARMLAVATAQNGSFFLASGTDLSADPDGKPVRAYLRDAYRYRPGLGWDRIADLPRAAVAAPTPAPAIGQTMFLVLSGDDGTLADFKPPEKHPGFPKSILAYDSKSNAWQPFGEMPAAHVVTTIAYWRDKFLMPSGEIRPGVRSPAVWSFDVGK